MHSASGHQPKQGRYHRCVTWVGLQMQKSSSSCSAMLNTPTGSRCTPALGGTGRLQQLCSLHGTPAAAQSRHTSLQSRHINTCLDWTRHKTLGCPKHVFVLARPAPGSHAVAFAQPAATQRISLRLTRHNFRPALSDKRHTGFCLCSTGHGILRQNRHATAPWSAALPCSPAWLYRAGRRRSRARRTPAAARHA